MSLKFSSEKKRVYCEKCQQYQPVMTREIGDAQHLVCSACLYPISGKQADIAACQFIIKGELPAVETRVTLMASGKKALGQAKPLPKPKTQTRPGPVEGTR